MYPFSPRHSCGGSLNARCRYTQTRLANRVGPDAIASSRRGPERLDNRTVSRLIPDPIQVMRLEHKEGTSQWRVRTAPWAHRIHPGRS
jgi:hypothetical protein